jgi:flavin-dependent dehydrogenase
MERRPVIIVGSGPAGSASALFLQAQQPGLAREALILEKAAHPRPKVCAGGLIPHTLQCLRELDVPLRVPNAVVHRANVEVPGRTVAYESRELCRVVRREQFDHLLVEACQQRGIEVRQNEKVLAYERDATGVRIETERGSYHARIVLGADGSGSRVRRELVNVGRDCVGKAVMCDVPVAGIDWSGFHRERYEFIFTAVPKGLRGYAWVFPCVIGGEPHANVGVYAVDARGNGPLLYRLLREHLHRLHAPAVPVKSFPIRWYGEGVRIATPHVLLAGDAAGVDALMGEGISYSLEYGRRAAAAAAEALATGDFELARYELGESWMGKKLRRLEYATRLFYGRTWPLWFAIASLSPQAREIGIRWYNGIDNWDRRRGREALWAWWRGDIAHETAPQLPL